MKSIMILESRNVRPVEWGINIILTYVLNDSKN